MTIKVYNVDTHSSHIYTNAGICDSLWTFEVFDLNTHEIYAYCSYLKYDWEEV